MNRRRAVEMTELRERIGRRCLLPSIRGLSRGIFTPPIIKFNICF